MNAVDQHLSTVERGALGTFASLGSAAVDRGEIEGVAELSAEELAGLVPVVEGMP